MISRDAPVGALDTDPSYRHRFGGAALIYASNQLLIRRLCVVHNHPSGDPTPSRADIEMTRQVRDAAKGVGITLHDHLVIGHGQHASFKSLGLL